MQKIIGYWEGHREYIRYDEYLALGLPIGSGVVEGACRHLVKDRMEGTGMRWTVAGAEAILKLRAVYLNGDWDRFWAFHVAQEKERRFGTRQWRPVAQSASAAPATETEGGGIVLPFVRPRRREPEPQRLAA